MSSPLPAPIERGAVRRSAAGVSAREFGWRGPEGTKAQRPRCAGLAHGLAPWEGADCKQGVTGHGRCDRHDNDEKGFPPMGAPDTAAARIPPE